MGHRLTLMCALNAVVHMYLRNVVLIKEFYIKERLNRLCVERFLSRVRKSHTFCVMR